MVFSPVHPFRDIRLIVTTKFLAVEATDKVLSSGVTERTVTEAAKQYPFLFVGALYRKFE